MMDLLLATSGGGAQVAGGGYVDDVFSAYTYTGNGSTQTINNGIDLAGKGGLVWIKGRSAAIDNIVFDTVRGATKGLNTNLTDAQANYTNVLTAFTSSGFSLGAPSTYVNTNGNNYVSWTFCKAPKFFDVVTYTGDGQGITGGGLYNPQSHSLGITPGMVIVKRLDSTSNWVVWHRGDGSAAVKQICLNLTNASGESGGTVGFTSSVFYPSQMNGIDGNAPNINGATYVAYLFAHDPSADGIIQCGSFTTDASGNATVNLGWEPQFSMVKAISTTSDWVMLDSMRGWNMSANDATLLANTSGAETVATERGNPTATGFDFKGGAASQTYIYLAIRRPNKPPTTGTQVYNAIARTGTGAAATVTGVGFAPDYLWDSGRGAQTPFTYDRLRGAAKQLTSSGTQAESVLSPTDTLTAWGMDGYSTGADASGYINSNSVTYINHFFRRAPCFFDVVCDTGTGVAHAITHNLTKVPELIIRKSRSANTQWEVWHSALAETEKLVLNSTAAKATDATAWSSTLPTSTQFTVGTGANVNTNAATYVTYLFATLAGISKVGSYTGNGTSQTINCGFATGARFILIKRTDATGDWYVWDTVRGIVAANDPHLSLNTSAAEVTTDDSVDPEASGFIVNQNTATNINVNGGQYIFLAIA